jgi:hypothetical protein
MANASFISYDTPAGSSVGAGPVNAQATFTTAAGSITILLQDLQVNPTNVGQLVSDLSFTLSTGENSGTLGHNGGTNRTVAGDGSFTDGLLVLTGWALSTDGGGLELSVIGTPAAPTHLIIGPPDGSNLYSNADTTIAGNGSNNPFLGESASFFLAVPGVTADSIVVSATFSFGTTAGVDVPGVQGSEVPEPAALSVLAMGGLVLFRRRRTA